MSLRLQVDPGGEKYLSWAKSKLDQMKADMKKSGLKVQSKHFYISTSESIWIKSLCVGYDVFLDWIRIMVGGAGWDFHGVVIDLDALTVSATLGLRGQKLGVISPDTGLTAAVSSLGLSFGFVRVDSTWKFIDPQQKLSAVHGGVYDGYSVVLPPMSSNSVEQMAAVSNDFGATTAYITPSSAVVLDFTPSLVTAYPTIADPAPDDTQTYTPAAPNFYVFNNYPGGGSPEYRVAGINEAAVIQSQTDPYGLSARHAGSLYDMVFTRMSSDALQVDYYSARLGLIASGSRFDYGGGTGGIDAGGVDDGSTVVGLANSFVHFDVERFQTDFGDLDLNTDVRIGVTKIEGQFGVDGLGYTDSKVEVDYVAGSTDYGSTFTILGTAATRSQAYAFIVNQIASSTNPDFEIRCVDGDGGSTIIDAAFPVPDGFNAAQIEFVFGATLATPYMACFDRVSGTRKLRIYDNTGLVHETDALFKGYNGVKNVLFVNGNTRDHVFFIVEGAVAGEVWQVRDDGQMVELNGYLPGRNITTPSGSTHSIAALTDRGTIYNLIASPVAHITNLQGDPLAPVIKEYALPGENYLASAAVPARASIMRMQEFEAWAAPAP